MQKLVWLFAILLCHIELVGCTSSTEERGRVHGKVTIDGQPLASGQIRFFAISGGIGTDGEVKDGAYDIPAAQGMTAGKYRVEISSPRATGRKVPDRDGGPGDTKDEFVENLPAKFNQQSTIQIDYDPATDKPFDLNLKK